MAFKFLLEVYGAESIGVWALRDFYSNRVQGKDENAKSRFDKNLDAIMDLRDEKILGLNRCRYKSKNFVNDKLETMDYLLEKYKDNCEKRSGIDSFLKFIEKSIDEM